MPPANRADAMAGMNQQGQLFNQQQQQQQQQHQRAGLLGEQVRYNPPVRPQHPKIGYDQQRGLGGGMAPSFWDMGPTPRKQNQQFGMDYRQQQPLERHYLNPLERDVVQPQMRQQGSQSEFCIG